MLVTLRRYVPTACLGCALSVAANAQVSRYELGLRLRDFERNLAACTEDGPRQAALVELEKAVQAFFRLDTRGVAAAVDQADLAVRGLSLSGDQKAARSLQLSLTSRLADPKDGKLDFESSSVFAVEGEWPRGLRLHARLDSDAKANAEVSLDELPASGSLTLGGVTPGEHEIAWWVTRGEEVVLTRHQSLSLATDLTRRLEALAAAAERAAERKGAARSIESTTLVALSRTVHGMTRKRPEETILPGARLLAEAEDLVGALQLDKPYYTAERTGQFWLRVPLAGETTSIRMLAPVVADGSKRPIVIALHGAGGSENMFFDGYGDGLAVRLAAARGWFLVAPRSSLVASRSGGLEGTDLPALVAALAERWPIDTSRIAVVGHSMGAAQAIASTSKNPTRYRAVAALGGGGSVNNAPGIKALPFYVGAGSRDFGRAGAEQLHQRLTRLGARSSWREFPEVEHLSIVQFALPEVFEFFANCFAP